MAGEEAKAPEVEAMEALMVAAVREAAGGRSSSNQHNRSLATDLDHLRGVLAMLLVREDVAGRGAGGGA